MARSTKNLLIEEMYNRYARQLKRYLLGLCGDNDLADDLTAETFLKAINNIENFRGGNILTWLCTIGKRTYFDYRKKRENANLPLTDDLAAVMTAAEPLPEQAFVEKEKRIRLYRLLGRLEPDAREVVYLRMFTDLSFREIGQVLGWSENRARVTFYRSKIKLKEMMDDED